jgi:RNA polymerase sigma-70 factor (ECF subfamily)
VDASSAQTSPTLLVRLRVSPPDQEAWQAFVTRYGPRIYSWCRRWQLTEEDAQDVTQIVLMRLVEAMRRFEYDPAGSFRGWLRTLTHNAWCDFLARRALRGSGDTDVLRTLETVAARDDLVARLEEEFDQELLEQAMSRVRQRVLATHWEVFRLTALEGLSGAEAAARLGLNVATVFAIRSKVQKQIKEEVQTLENAEPTAAKECPP